MGVSRLSIQVEAAPVTVHNYTLDAEDASCGLRITLGMARYAGRLLLNRPAPKPVLPSMSRIAAKRCAACQSSAELLKTFMGMVVDIDSLHFTCVQPCYANLHMTASHTEHMPALDKRQAGFMLLHLCMAAGKLVEWQASSF